METFENFEKTIDESILYTAERLKVLQQIKLLLNSDILKNNNSKVIKGNNSNSGLLATVEKDSSYPYKKTVVERLDYLLKRENRALKNSEFYDLIAKAESPKAAKKMRTALYTYLTNLVERGKAVRCKFNNDKKLSFYVKPEWIDKTGEYRGLINDFYPSPEALAGIEKERLKPENIDWSDEPKTTLNIEP